MIDRLHKIGFSSFLPFGKQALKLNNPVLSLTLGLAWLGVFVAPSFGNPMGHRLFKEIKAPVRAFQTRDKGDFAETGRTTTQVEQSNSNQLADEELQQRAQELIEQLAAPRFLMREEATQALWRLGPRAESAILHAIDSSDRETQARAQLILDRFQYGIFPDTPPDVVRLVEQYRTGNLNIRERVIHELISRKQTATLTRLFNLTDDLAYRNRLSSWILSRFDETIAPLVVEGEIETVTELLKLAADDAEEIAMLTRLLVWNGTLDEAIKETRERIDGKGLDFTNPVDQLARGRDRQLLVSLLHAQGDYRGALEQVEEVLFIEDLPRRILVSSKNWKAWADWENNHRPELDENVELLPSDVVESMAYAIFANHLAGNQTQRESLIKELESQVAGDASLYFFLAEAFFATDQFDKAIEVITEKDRTGAFEMLCSQHRYDEAFALIELEPNVEGVKKWIELKLELQKTTSENDRIELYFALDVAEQFAIVGEKEIAKTAYEMLAKYALENIDNELMLFREVCRQEFERGYRDEAIANLRQLFMLPKYVDSEALQGDIAIRVWLSDEPTLAQFWWTQLLNKYKDPIDRLQMIETILAGTAEGEEPTAEVLEQLEAASKQLETIEEKRAFLRERNYLAESFLRHHRFAEAIEQLEKAYETGDSSAAQRLGHELRKQGNYEQAITWYDRAYEKNPSYADSSFFKGVCLEELGRSEEAETAKRTSYLLSLTSPRMQQLIDSLRVHGFEDEAIELIQLQIRSSEPMNGFYSDACGRLGNTIYEDNPGVAADAWRQVFIGVMSSDRNFVSRASYLNMAELIHHGLALRLFESGQPDEAMKHIEFCMIAQPGNTQIAEDFVPLLEKAGDQDKADAIYSDMKSRYLRLIEKFPSSALHHNNLAWFAARCERDLDEALEHSEIAVKLDPNSSNYLDTLAEIVFLKGDAKQAYELAKRCIQLNPSKPHYQEQLKRFKAAMNE